MRPKPGATGTHYTAIQGEAFLTQYRDIRAAMSIKGFSRPKKPLKKRLKTWKLKKEEFRLMFEEAFDQNMESGGRNWKNAGEGIMAAAVQTCGWTTGRREREK